jgi:AcrR family transcriptional regulator
VSPSPPREPHHLPSGRHGLTREQVRANQRARVVEAVADVSSAAGYGPMTVEDIVVTAGISRRAFYELFASKEDAFLAALDDVARRLHAEVAAAFATADGFADRIEAGLAALLGFLARHPSSADMCLVQLMAAGPEAVERRSVGLRDATMLVLGAVAHDLPQRGRPPEIVAEGLVGGMYEIVSARVVTGRVDRLPELLPDLMHFALLPYLGPAAATERRRRLMCRRAQS